MRSKRTTPTGTRARHSRSCPAHRDRDATCKCRPSWEANVWSGRDQRQLRKTFPTLAAAKAWRADTASALHRGQLRAPTRTTVREAAETWLAGATAGTVRNRNGRTYKPSAL